MSFERAHAYAARGEATEAAVDDLAPGRLTRSQQLAPGREPMWVQRKASGSAIAAGAELAVGRASTSAGLALPDDLRKRFEAALGADLSGVRLHTGDASRAAAAALGAQAYTVGQDIHFAAGHDPLGDERLLAHEVAHTVQQRVAAPGPGFAVSSPDDGFEHEADRAADAMLAGVGIQLGAAPAPAVIARKVDPETSGPGEITQNNTTGYTSGPTQVHSDADAKASVLTTLPAGGWIHIIGSNGSFYVVNYDDTKKGYIDHDDLDVDGTPTAVDHDPAPDASATPAHATAGERYRAAVQKALDFWKGAKEGDAKFTQFRSAATLDTARKNAGLEGKTYTTCIEFLTQVQGDAARDAHVHPVTTADSRFAVAAERKKLPADAWHAASPGMTERPRKGDVFYLTFARNVNKPDGSLKFGKGDFSHVGYFNGLEPHPAAPGGDAAAAGATATEAVELWHTVDGGQGTATQYDAKGALLRSGHEELKESDRFYLPAKNLIAGEKIQGDADARTLLGWIDIEKLVAADAPPDP